MANQFCHFKATKVAVLVYAEPGAQSLDLQMTSASLVIKMRSVSVCRFECKAAFKRSCGAMISSAR